MGLGGYLLILLSQYVKGVLFLPFYSSLLYALSSCIKAEQYVDRIQGVFIPDIPLEYIQSSYADDTHLVLAAPISNLQAAKIILDKFSAASGLSINWNKSDAHWLAEYEQPEDTSQLQWLWKAPSEPGTLLGFSFGSGLHSEAMFSAALAKLKGRLKKWDAFPLTLQGKGVVANHLIASGLWYIMTLNAACPTRLQRLQKLLVAFIWGARDSLSATV
jgi:hypothetical protein